MNFKGTKSPFPKFLNPMLATLVDEPPEGKEWVYEVKWDGYRSIAFCNGKEINLISRNNKSFNKKFYPIADALQEMNLHFVLDGEIVVLNERGIADFGNLQNWRSESDGPLVYYVFDLLWLNGYSLMNLPLIERKKILHETVPFGEIIKESELFTDSPQRLMKEAKKLNLEGILAKEKNSFYLPGLRTQKWLKIKSKIRHEVVIGGYTKNEESSKPFSSLLVGIYKNGDFHYIGKIGTGYSLKEQHALLEKFKKFEIKTCPFTSIPDVNIASRFRPNPPHAKVIWLKPTLVCEVAYIELTGEGIMRHPSFQGLREDKNPLDVHEEKPQKIKSPATKKIRVKALKKLERKTLLNPHEETQVKSIDGKSLKFNHLSKLFWPKEGITKRDLINYYYQVAPYILPYLKDRPQSLNRFPNGIEGFSFYQKDVTKAPEWMEKFPYHTSDGKDKNYLILKDEADLLWMANLGAIEMNPWNSKIDQPDYPDWCSIDIDPTDENTFEQVIVVAQVVYKILRELKIDGYCKTSGKAGLHIYIPMGAKYPYEEVQLFGRKLAGLAHRHLPKITSVERMSKNRKGLIYIDFLQNRPKATLAAPYSVRPQPQASVSMPLHWDEVKKGLKQDQFHLKNAMERIKSEGDLFMPVLGKGVNISKIKELL